MTIREQIEVNLKQALKNKDEITVSTLRMLKSALQNKEIEKRQKTLAEEEVVKAITRQIKEHQDSIEQFKLGNRPELVEKETRELEILKKYLPAQVSDDEIAAVVKSVITQTAAQGKQDMGKVMKQVMVELKGRADGKIVNQIVSAQLGS